MVNEAAYDALLDHLVGWGGGYPVPIIHPFNAFGVLVSAPLVPLSDGLEAGPCKILDPPLPTSVSKHGEDSH